MLGSAIIVFREVLEAALIIGIIAVATRNLRARNGWLVGGIVAGVIGSIVVALFTGKLADLAEGVRQELFNAAVLGLAAAEIGAFGQVHRRQPGLASGQVRQAAVQDHLRRDQHLGEDILGGIVGQDWHRHLIDDTAGVRLLNHLVQRRTGLCLVSSPAPSGRPRLASSGMLGSIAPVFATHRPVVCLLISDISQVP